MAQFYLCEAFMHRKRNLLFTILLLMLVTLVTSTACTVAQTKGTQRVSVASNEVEANLRSKQPTISADGRYVAFASDASNLVDGDYNGVTDIFIRDLVKETTTRVSVSSAGIEGDKASYWPFISPDGRYVTFTSEADNLVDSDTNGVGDVFLHDTKTGETQLISRAVDGTIGNDLSFWSSISSDGRYLVFMSSATNLVPSDNNDTWDIFLYDKKTGQPGLVSSGYDGSPANSQSEYPVISADGRYVAFASDATNIVEGDTNGSRDVFEFDRQSGKTMRVSVATDGTQADKGNAAFVISISADGKFVAFPSLATSLVANDTNQVWDVFVHDRDKGETTRVSVSSTGLQSDGDSFGVSISPDGRFVAFGSNATNLVSEDLNGVMDVFVHDRQSGLTSLVSISADGKQGNEASGFTMISPDGVDFAYGTQISSDGNTVAFMSNASTLVVDDTNATQDIFVNTR
jgi:Tol biopolymer transport system component